MSALLSPEPQPIVNSVTESSSHGELILFEGAMCKLQDLLGGESLGEGARLHLTPPACTSLADPE